MSPSLQSDSSHHHTPKSFAFQAWGLWFLATLFFAFQMIPRLWLGVAREHTMHQLSIDTDIFGYICALYYVGYAGMQIPLAMILDRWNPRWVLSGCILLLGASLWLFAVASDWHWAALARLITGMCSAAGFLGVSKVIAQWFPPRQYSAILGSSIALGIGGSVFGGRPILWCVQHYGVENVNRGMIALCALLALSMAAFMTTPPRANAGERFTFALLKQLVKSPVIWLLGAVNLLLVGPLEGFADAWAEPFLSHGFGLSAEQALGLASMVFIGLISASPLIPFLGQRIGHYGAILLCSLGIVSAFLALFVLSIIGFTSPAPHWILGGLLFFIGMCCAYQTNLLTLGREAVSPALGGVAVALLNAWNMSGGTVFHTVIGLVLKHRTQSIGHTAINYVWALTCIPFAALLGVGGVLWLRQRHKQEQALAGLGAASQKS